MPEPESALYGHQGLEPVVVHGLIENARANGCSGVWLCEAVDAIVKATDSDPAAAGE